MLSNMPKDFVGKSQLIGVEITRRKRPNSPIFRGTVACPHKVYTSMIREFMWGLPARNLSGAGCT